MGNIENHEKTHLGEKNETKTNTKNRAMSETVESSIENAPKGEKQQTINEKNKRKTIIILASIASVVITGIVVACACFLPQVFIKSPKSIDDISSIIVENGYSVYYSLTGNYPVMFSSDIMYSNPNNTPVFFSSDNEYYGSIYNDLDGGCHKALPFNFESISCHIKEQFALDDGGINMIISDDNKTHFAIMFSNDGSETSIIKLEDYKMYEFVVDGNDNTFVNYDKYGNSCHIAIDGEREFNNSECNTTRAVQMKRYAEEAEEFIQDFGLTIDDVRNYYSYIKENHIDKKIKEVKK